MVGTLNCVCRPEHGIEAQTYVSDVTLGWKSMLSFLYVDLDIKKRQQ